MDRRRAGLVAETGLDGARRRTYAPGMSRTVPHFGVAAGDPLTAEAAAEVLRAGGTAVDAVIAGALVACVAEPVLAGLLGGGFLMLREADGRTKLLDFFVQTQGVRSTFQRSS